MGTRTLSVQSLADEGNRTNLSENDNADTYGLLANVPSSEDLLVLQKQFTHQKHDLFAEIFI